MKVFPAFFLLLAVGNLAWAGPARIEVAVVPKKESADEKRSRNVTHEATKFQYSVTLTNRSFADVSGLSAEYRIFVRSDSGKGAVSQQKLERQEFRAEIPALPNNGRYSFDTEPVTLKTSQLDGGWYYTDGSRSKRQDKVAGVWIRILQDGKVVGEYLNPTSLASREKF